MKSVSINKGLRLDISGTPSKTVRILGDPTHVGVSPYRFPAIKPRLSVKTGDSVKIGSLLYRDKREPRFKFLSPGGGTVSKITYGPRRVIKEILIELDSNEEQKSFEPLSEDRIGQISRDELVSLLSGGGLWPAFRSLPFRMIADPDVTPPAIIVTLNGAEPFQPLPEVYLKGAEDVFRFGLSALYRLAPRVHVAVSGDDDTPVLSLLKTKVTHTVSGDYPAGDPGVFLYYIKESPEENQAWYIDGQDVIRLGRFLKTGEYPLTRTVALGGGSIAGPEHVVARIGSPLSHIAKIEPGNNGTRFIAGGVFNGLMASPESHLGFYDRSLTVLPEAAGKSFLGFIRPGFSKPSRSRAFFSVFNKREKDYDCDFHGEKRACINCGYCARVCPVDILPQYAMKCIAADEIEESLLHGLLDCVECGACTYVCPSKIDLSDTLKTAKAAYYKEING